MNLKHLKPLGVGRRAPRHLSPPVLPVSPLPNDLALIPPFVPPLQGRLTIKCITRIHEPDAGWGTRPGVHGHSIHRKEEGYGTLQAPLSLPRDHFNRTVTAKSSWSLEGSETAVRKCSLISALILLYRKLRGRRPVP